MGNGECESPAERFFAKACGAFQQAAQAAAPPIERDYLIGEYTVRLVFAGPTLLPLITPAIAHLAVPSNASAPSLTVCLWDSASTGAPMPARPWSLSDCLARNEIRGYNEAGVRTVFDSYAGVLELLNLKQGVALYWVRDARELPYYESGAPLRAILHWWLSTQGLQLVHGAAVGNQTGGALLAGQGGSGKSTTALACLSAGLGYASDDYCLLATKPAPHAYSVYNTGKLDADSLLKLAHFGPCIQNAERSQGGKALLFLHAHFPERIASGFPLRAVLLPRVTGRKETTLRLASPAKGLKALAPSTIFQLAGAGQSALQTMAELMRQVPCYHLELGTRLQQIPDVIKPLLAGD